MQIPCEMEMMKQVVEHRDAQKPFGCIQWNNSKECHDLADSRLSGS